MRLHQYGQRVVAHFLPILATTLLLVGCGLVGRSSAPILDRTQDERIQREVTARLSSEPSLDVANLRATVEGGVVILNGSVRGLGAWKCALTNAGLIPGVRTVVDYLVIESGPRDVQCRAPRPDSAVITGR